MFLTVCSIPLKRTDRIRAGSTKHTISRIFRQESFGLRTENCGLEQQTVLLKKFDITEYSDDGVAITSYWDTPELDGNSFSEKKNIYLYCCKNRSLRQNVRQIPSKSQRNLGNDNGLQQRSELSRFFRYRLFGVHFFHRRDTSHNRKKIKIKNVDKIQFQIRKLSIRTNRFQFTKLNLNTPRVMNTRNKGVEHGIKR